MKKLHRSRLMWFELSLAAAAVLIIAVPASRIRLVGSLRGESFFEGMPESYWHNALLDRSSRERASGELTKAGSKAIPLLLRFRIQHSDGGLVIRPILQDMGETAMHGLLTALQDKDKAMRRMAALELRLFEKHRAAIFPGLTESLRDEDVEVRKEAAATLSGFCCREEADALAAAFTDALADESRAVRQQAARALAYLNPPRDAGAAVLLEGLQYGTALERVSAAAALGRIRHQASIPFLGRACADQDCGVRSAAAQALGRFGPDANSAVPLLLLCMSDDDFVVRHLAADAVGAIAPENLIASLQHQAPVVRTTAVQALTRIQPPVKAAVPALIKALDDPSPDVRAVAGKALERVLLWGHLQ